MEMLPRSYDLDSFIQRDSDSDVIRQLNDKEKNKSYNPSNLQENLDHNSLFSKLNASISTIDHEIASDEEFPDEIISSYNNEDSASCQPLSERDSIDTNLKDTNNLDTAISPKTFERNSLVESDNDFEENIVLDIEAQIKLAADKIIQDHTDNINPSRSSISSVSKNDLRVRFVPEIQELAKEAFEIAQIRRRQEKELEEYERALQNYYELYGQGEEEEEEADDNFLPRYEYGVLMFQDDQLVDPNEIKPDDAVHNNEDHAYQLKDLIVDDTRLLEAFSNTNITPTSEKPRSKQPKEQIILHNSPTASIGNDIQDEANLQSITSIDEQIETNLMGTGLPQKTPEDQIQVESSPEKENQPVIPLIDLSQFNSSKAASPPKKKQNKFLESVNRLNRKANTNQTPEIRAPVSNQAKPKSNVKKKLPPAKNTKPIVLQKYENENNESSSSDSHQPRSILQQAQQKNTENTPEELRNNGFLITFLPAPAVASQNNTNNKILTTIPANQKTEKSSIHKHKLAELTEIKDEEEIPLFTDEELEAAAKEIYETKKMPQKEMIEPLLGYIKKTVFKCIIDQDYDEAEKLKEVEKFISAKSITTNTKEEKKQVVKSIEDKLESAKSKILEIKREYKYKLENFEEEIATKSDELKQKHSEEITNFENTWDNQSVLMQYTKPSSQLIEIRRQQKNKALANDFQGARELKKRGDQLEKDETKRAQAKAVTAMQTAYNTLIRKQKREEEYAKQNWQRQRILIENERDHEINAAELKIKQLKAKLVEIRTRERDKDKSKPIASTRQFQTSSRSSSLSSTVNSVNRPSSVSDQNRRIRNNGSGQMSTTPRTRQQIAEFRTAPRQERLALNGFDVHKYMKSSNVSKNATKPPISRVKLEKTDF